MSAPTADLDNMRVAIVHDYLNAYGGAESVVNAIHEIWPEAPIYTALYDPRAFAGTGAFKEAQVVCPAGYRTPIVNRFYKYFTATFPLVFESFDLRDYDVVISSSANFAKGVLTNPEQLHIAYIHTVPRFLYGYPGETSKRDRWYWQLVLRPLDSYLRLWDFQAAQRPDYLLCNGANVKRRIAKFYRREAEVIHPFYSVPANHQEIRAEVGDYYLWVGRMSRYKHADKAILAANRLKVNLKVAGTGKDFNQFRSLAGPTVEMLGFVAEERKVALMKGCKAFLATVEAEDFGMVPLEAMSFGKPVIALRSGGYRETVVEGKSGIFYDQPTVESLTKAMRRFETGKVRIDPDQCRQVAARFTKERFQRRLKRFVAAKYQEIAK